MWIVLLVTQSLVKISTTKRLPQPDDKPVVIEQLAVDATWEDEVTARLALESAFDEVVSDFGFRRDLSLEEHPSEASSYTHVYTAEGLSPESVAEVMRRLKASSTHVEVEPEGDDWVSFFVDTNYGTASPDRDMDLVYSVDVAKEGANAFDREGRAFVAMRVHHVLYRPEDSFQFLNSAMVSNDWVNDDGRLSEFQFEKRPKEELAALVWSELVLRGYAEDESLRPWHRFTKGCVEVTVCNPPEYTVVDGELVATGFVPDPGSASERHEWPVVLIKVRKEPKSAG